MTIPVTATRLKAPVAIAVLVILGDLFDATIGFAAYRSNRGPTVPGASSWAAIYLLGIEAAAGALILLLAVLAAGRSRGAAGVAQGLAWFRLLIVAAFAVLIIFGLAFNGLDASDALAALLALADAVAGVFLCTTLARRTRRRLS